MYCDNFIKWPFIQSGGDTKDLWSHGNPSLERKVPTWASDRTIRGLKSNSRQSYCLGCLILLCTQITYWLIDQIKKKGTNHGERKDFIYIRICNWRSSGQNVRCHFRCHSWRNHGKRPNGPCSMRDCYNNRSCTCYGRDHNKRLRWYPEDRKRYSKRDRLYPWKIWIWCWHMCSHHCDRWAVSRYRSWRRQSSGS